MSFDPNQFSPMWEALPDSAKESLLGPPSKELGNMIGDIVHILGTPFRIIKIVSDEKVEQFAKRTKEKVSAIPDENRDSTKLPIAVKTIEDAKYSLNDEGMQEIFSNLIANSLNNTKNVDISIRFSTVLSQLSPKDALFLKKIHDAKYNSILTGKLIVKNGDGSHHPVTKIVFDTLNDNMFLGFEQSTDVLSSLGVIEVHKDAWLVSDEYNSEYQNIEEFLRTSGVPNNSELEKGYISLTTFGQAFLKACLE